MNVIQHFFGVKLGGFVDIYEEQLVVDREAALKAIAKVFEHRSFGRAYDGAYLLIFSKRRELAFYLRPNVVRFENRHHFPISVRLLPDRFPRKIERVARLLRGEPAAAPNGGPAEPLGNSRVTPGPPSVS